MPVNTPKKPPQRPKSGPLAPMGPAVAHKGRQGAEKGLQPRPAPRKRAESLSNVPEWVRRWGFVVNVESIALAISRRAGIAAPLLRLAGQSKRNARRALPIAELESGAYSEMARHVSESYSGSDECKRDKERAGKKSGTVRHPADCQVCKVLRSHPPRHRLKLIQRELDQMGIHRTVQAIGLHRKAILKANTKA